MPHLIALLGLLLLQSSYLAQEPPESARPGEVAVRAADTDDAALRRLAEIDERLYRPADHGLVAMSFAYLPKMMGVESVPFRIRYRQRDGAGDRVDFLAEDGTVLEELPHVPGLDLVRREGDEPIDQRAFLTDAFLTTSRGLAQAVRGMSLREQYRGFRIRETREVQNQVERISLVLEPAQPKKLRRLRITLDRNGLPWEWDRSYLDGSSSLQLHVYKEFEGRYLLHQMQETVTPGGSTSGTAYAYQTLYQTVRGLAVPASIEKLGPSLPEWAKGKTELLDFRVNGDVPEFEPMK